MVINCINRPLLKIDSFFFIVQISVFIISKCPNQIYTKILTFIIRSYIKSPSTRSHTLLWLTNQFFFYLNRSPEILYLWSPEQIIFLLPLFVQDAVLCVARPHHHVLYQRIVILQYPFYKYFYKTSFSLVPLPKLLILFCAKQKLSFFF